MKKVDVILLLMFLILLAAKSHSQEQNFIPYFYFQDDSISKRVINKYNLIYNGDESATNIGFASADGFSVDVGYFCDSQGWGFYNSGIDTFYLAHEINIYLDSITRYDTIKTFNCGIIFINPFPDVYEKGGGNQDPYRIIASEKSNDVRDPASKLYTQPFYNDGKLKETCVLNDQNGTLYHIFDKNGKICAKGYYKNSEPKGVWFFFNADGYFWEHTFE